MKKELMKKMNSSDTPLGTLDKQRKKQEKLQTPYLVLSGAGKETGYVCGAIGNYKWLFLFQRSTEERLVRYFVNLFVVITFKLWLKSMQ